MVNGTAVGERNDSLAARFQAFLKQRQMVFKFGLAHVGSHTEQENIIETTLRYLQVSQRPNLAIGRWYLAGCQHGSRNIGAGVFKRIDLFFEVIVQRTTACPDIEDGFALKIQSPDCIVQPFIKKVGMVNLPGGVLSGIICGYPVKILPDLWFLQVHVEQLAAPPGRWRRIVMQ